MRWNRATTFLVLLGIVTAFPASGSEPGDRPDVELTRAGYELSPEGLKRAFEDVSPSAVDACLRYLDRMVENKSDYSVLIPYIEQYENKLPDASVFEGSRMTCIALRFVIDGANMTASERDKFVVRLRDNLFVKDARHGAYISAYNALIIAHKYANVDIKDDLLFLAQTGSLGSTDKAGWARGPAKDLFELCADTVTPEEARQLHDAWPNNPELQEFIRAHANRKGFLLELSPSEPPATR